MIVAEKSKKNLLMIAGAVVIIVIIGAGIWYWRGRTSVPGTPTGEAPSTIGGQIFEKKPVKDALPETNPFSDSETNPLKRVIKNPF